MGTLRKFIPLTKMEELPGGTLKVYGQVTAEEPDLDNEVCSYEKTKPFYIAKVEAMKKASSVPGMEQSIMPMREMHSLKAIGKGISIDFDDAKKTISMGFEVVDPDAILKFRKGVLLGFSQGGDYVGPKVPDPVFKGCKRYVANPGEVSGVDSPCLPSSLVSYMKGKEYQFAKADGSSELCKFAPKREVIEIELDIDAGQVLKYKGEQYETCSEDDSEVALKVGEQFYKVKKTEQDVLAERLDKLEQLILDGFEGVSKAGVVPPAVVPPAQNEPGPGPLAPGQGPVPKAAAAGDLTKEPKTKRKGGKDLSASDFAYVGDPEDTSTWKLPIHDKAHAQNALARFNQTEGIPADDKQKVKSKILSAAKKHGVDVASEAKKAQEALDFVNHYLSTGDVNKCMADVTDMAQVLQTLRVITGSQIWESEMNEGQAPTAQGLKQLVEDAVLSFKELVEDETMKLLATLGGEGGGKAMTNEELAKLAKARSAHLAKAKEMIKAHTEQMAGVHKAHHDHMSQLHSTHAEAVSSAPTVQKAAEMCKAHADHVTSISKAHMDHVNSLHKAHADAVNQVLNKAVSENAAGDSPSASSIVNTATVGGEPSAIDITSGAPHTTKALTTEDLEKALAKSRQEGEDAALEVFAKALAEAVKEEPAAAAPGIGDRGNIGSTANKAIQTHPVTKAADGMAPTGQEPTAVTISKDDVIAAGNGDPTAMLKLARSITPNAAGVPTVLQGKIGSRA